MLPLSMTVASAAMAVPHPLPARVIPHQPSVWPDDYTTTELTARIDKGCPFVMVFSGGTEEIGPYMAMADCGTYPRHWPPERAGNRVQF